MCTVADRVILCDGGLGSAERHVNLKNPEPHKPDPGPLTLTHFDHEDRSRGFRIGVDSGGAGYETTQAHGGRHLQ